MRVKPARTPAPVPDVTSGAAARAWLSLPEKVFPHADRRPGNHLPGRRSACGGPGSGVGVFAPPAAVGDGAGGHARRVADLAALPGHADRQVEDAVRSLAEAEHGVQGARHRFHVGERVGLLRQVDEPHADGALAHAAVWNGRLGQEPAPCLASLGEPREVDHLALAVVAGHGRVEGVALEVELVGEQGVDDALFADEFDLKRYALDPPVSRNDSKGKVIDFTRLAEARETWSRLLPQPADPDVAVDVLHAASGGALKSRAFWAVREMRRYGLWHDDALDRFACVPDGRVRKRAVRMGRIDLPEKADTFADMKAVSRALHAVLRLGEAPDGVFDLPISMSGQRCEIWDAARMAACPIPHCRWRREHADA